MEIGQEIIQELLILDKIHILFVASSVVMLRILSLPHCTPPFLYHHIVLDFMSSL